LGDAFIGLHTVPSTTMATTAVQEVTIGEERWRREEEEEREETGGGGRGEGP